MSAADPKALAARSPITGPGADMYQYELVVREGDERNQVSVRGNHLPEELRPLIALLEQHVGAQDRGRHP